MAIHYAQCWEDPRVLCEALAVTPNDDVVSIASGGDNTLALLLLNPCSLTAVDHNPEQLHLLRLKLLAIERLEYEEFIGFVGATPCPERVSLYRQLRDELDGPARTYWDQRSDVLSGGVIHCGKFERYFAHFRRWILPLVHGRRAVHRLLSTRSLDEQRQFYDRAWSSRRWQWLFRLFFGRFVLGRLGRSPAFFRYVEESNIAETLLARTRRGLTQIPISDNYFVHHILTGTYLHMDTTHPYLMKGNFRTLKENVGRVRVVQAGLVEYLKTLPRQSVAKFNLSDVFEYQSQEEFEQTLREISRVGRPGARLAFWTLFIPRTVPPSLESRLESESELAQELHSRDRTFFYGGFNLWVVKPDAELGCGG